MIKVLHQHSDFYAVYKPAGVGFHDEEHETGFFNQCQSHFSEQLFPVHRLDKITSGVMLVARNKQAATWFQRAFEAKTIQKFYLALSDSKPKKKQGSVIGDMSKARHGQWKLSKSKHNPAVSRFHSWGIEGAITGLRLFLIKPETGKTHQIRVALKSLGAAILGDELYSGSSSDRGYLHAFALSFQYFDESISVESVPQEGELFLQNADSIVAKLVNWHSLPWSTKS